VTDLRSCSARTRIRVWGKSWAKVRSSVETESNWNHDLQFYSLLYNIQHNNKKLTNRIGSVFTPSGCAFGTLPLDNRVRYHLVNFQVTHFRFWHCLAVLLRKLFLGQNLHKSPTRTYSQQVGSLPPVVPVPRQMKHPQMRVMQLGPLMEKILLCVRHDRISRGRFTDRVDAEVVVDHLEASISPIQCLPTEILSDIFMHSRSSDYPDQGAALLFAQICSRWRAIALSMPWLWSRLRVRYSVSTMERAVPILAIWLARSGQCLLSLDLHQFNSGVGTGTSAFMTTIMPHCNRLQHFSMYACLDTLQTFCSISTGIFPMLESVSLGPPFIIYGVRYRAPACDTFKNAPQLRTIHIESIDHPSFMEFPWIQLTTISIAVHDRECLTILQLCPNLESCIFRSRPSPAPIVNISYRPFIHPRIRLFRIEAQPESEFINCLTLPALRHVSIYRFHTATDLISLLTRSACCVETLAVDITLPLPEFERLVKHLPHLVELGVQQRNYIDNVNGSLLSLSLVGESKTDLCPELRVLRLAYNSPPDSQIVLNMLNSRWKGHSGCMVGSNIAGLESFHLVLVRTKPVVHLMAGLKVLQDQGLNVSITNLQANMEFA
jgi:hypothetical protein